MDGKYFVVPNVFHSAAADGYELVTGASALTYGAKLVGLLVTNQTGSRLYAQVHDGHAEPSNGAVPVLEVECAANGQTILDLSRMGPLDCKTGIVVAGSSTSGSYTAAASSMFVTALWI